MSVSSRSITARPMARSRNSLRLTRNMAATFPSPAAGCRMAPPNGRCAPSTEPATPIYPNRVTGSAEHDAAVCFNLSGGLSFDTAARARRPRGGNADTQGGPVGNEGGADRLCDAGNDDAALHRREHRQGYELDVLADGEGDVFQTGYPENGDRYVSDSVCKVGAMSITSH